jgi:iron(III) transport system ATP-binding protein
MSVEVEDLSKAFGDTVVLKSIRAEFASGQISVLLGPSGCGKTTTLRCIAGLEQPTSGRIAFSDRVVYQKRPAVWVPVERRRISMVFQSYAIWPHMTVFQNVSLPLRAVGVKRQEINARVAEVLDMVGLREFSDRSATQLSGGQQQRVALARCAVSDSPIILMDEPLSNLDAKLRVAMRGEILELQRRLKRTILFVTHDQEEAMSIADTVYLFREGSIVQQGAPNDLYEYPQTRYAAEFLGRANILPLTDVAVAGGVARLGGIDLAVPDHVTGAGFLLCIRPEKWRVVSPDERAVLRGTVMKSQYLGDRAEMVVSTEMGPMLVVEVNSRHTRPGETIGLKVDADDVRFLDAS